MSELRRKMQADLRIRNYAERTQKTYISRVAEMARYYSRSPADVSADEVREYLRYLKDERKVSRSAFVQVIAGLRFLYRFTLGRPEMVPKIPYPRSKRRHPVVLSRQEVVRWLKAVPNLKHRTVALVLPLHRLGARRRRGRTWTRGYPARKRPLGQRPTETGARPLHRLQARLGRART